jgi:toxin-antitoxin system PIN domain toxin
MIDLLDANILIGAFRPDTENHLRLKAWLEEALAENRPISFPPLVEIAFLRIVTHPSIFRDPSTLDEAAAFLEALHSHSAFHPAPWTAKIRKLMLRRSAELGLRGNDLNDAALAVIAEAMRWRLVSCDMGYARFKHIDWFNPASTDSR